MKNFSGNILFLDRSDINTDEIIPARYLTEISKKALMPHLLEDLRLEEFVAERDVAGKTVIITRANFGCGSSREHAPWALEANGIHLVIAESFARIFRQNMYNCGMMAVELPLAVLEDIFGRFAAGPAKLYTRFEEGLFVIEGSGKSLQVPFELSDFDRRLVEVGGWVEFADAKY